jgi:hypothetical protein
MPFEPTEAWLAEVRRRVVELPHARKQRFMRDYQLPASDAQTFVWDVPLGTYFEKAVTGAKNPKAVANWIINNLRAKLSETSTPLSETKVKPADIPELVALVDGGKISGTIAQTVFAEMFATGEAPAKIVEAKGLAQVSDTGAIGKLSDAVIARNPKIVKDIVEGKDAALNALKGQVMKASKGSANPQIVGNVLQQRLKIFGEAQVKIIKRYPNAAPAPGMLWQPGDVNDWAPLRDFLWDRIHSTKDEKLEGEYAKKLKDIVAQGGTTADPMGEANLEQHCRAIIAAIEALEQS